MQQQRRKTVGGAQDVPAGWAGGAVETERLLGAQAVPPTPPEESRAESSSSEEEEEDEEEGKRSEKVGFAIAEAGVHAASGGSLQDVSFTSEKEKTFKATILADEELLGFTWYFIQVEEEGLDHRRSYLRRYEDFQRLDEELRNSAKAMGGKMCYGANKKIREVAPMPEEASRFGFRKRLSMLGFSDFAGKRKTDLQAYLDTLTAQIKEPEDEPFVAAFFGDAGVILPSANPTHKSALNTVLQNFIMLFTPRSRQEAKREVFESGGLVRIVGLREKMEFNGRRARVVSWKPAELSYVLKMEEGGGLAQLRGENVRGAAVPVEDGRRKSNAFVGGSAPPPRSSIAGGSMSQARSMGQGRRASAAQALRSAEVNRRGSSRF